MEDLKASIIFQYRFCIHLIVTLCSSQIRMCSNPRQSQSDALVDRRIPIANVSNVALEMANIEWVEPNLGITDGFF